jgi:hypothetical protein
MPYVVLLVKGAVCNDLLGLKPEKTKPVVLNLDKK